MHLATQKLFLLGLMTCTNQEVIFIDIIAMGFGKSNTYFCYPCVMTVELFLWGGGGGGGGVGWQICFVILCLCIYVLRKCAYRYIQHII